VTCLLKFVFFAAAAALLIGHQNARAAWVAADTDPDVIASAFNHRDFNVIESAGTGYGGQAFVGGADDKIWLTRLAYQGARRGDGQSVWILLHEIGHTLGLADEHAASVFGYQHLIGVLRRYYGQSLKQARAGYRVAVLASRAMSQEYQP
jgi:hypothetical protein